MKAKQIVTWGAALVVAAIAGACSCGSYGTGETFGYVTTVERNNGWAATHMRASYNSSQTDCYNVELRDEQVLADLERASLEETRIKATFLKERKAGLNFCSWGRIIKVEFLEGEQS